MKLSERMMSRDNNFDFLRLIAASLVVLSHTYRLSGSLAEPLRALTSYETFGGLGVNIFFIISGFLITKSWSQAPKVIPFFKKRILRIMPGLIASVFFCVLVIGPLVTTLSLEQYFSNTHTYLYIKNIFLYFIRYDLPGAFVNNPFSNVVNGSLWSLPVEFYAYCMVAALGILGIISRKKMLAIFVISLLFIYWLILNRPDSDKLVFFNVLVIASLKNIIFFFIGSAFYLYREKVTLNGYVCLGLVLLFIISCRTSYVRAAAFITIPYLILYIAYKGIPFISKVGKYGDFSYGIYVYACPVQQTVFYFWGKHLNKVTFFISAFFITLFLAVLSWYIVEKPFLKLKNVPIFRLQTRQLLFKKVLGYEPID